VVDLYDAVRRVAGVDKDAEYADPRPGEILRSVLDVSRAGRELGWRAEHDLDSGLAETWAWIAG
jgi:UDP-glucose 4-epimerase